MNPLYLHPSVLLFVGDMLTALILYPQGILRADHKPHPLQRKQQESAG